MSSLRLPDHQHQDLGRHLAVAPVASRPRPSLLTHRPPVDLDLLAALPLLRSMGPLLLRQIAERAVVRRIPRHGVVFEQGSRECGLYFLLTGQAQVLRQNQRGRALVIDQLRPGEHFGELSAIDDAPQHATVRCAEPSEVLVISCNDFIDLLHRSPALLQALLQALVHRVRRKNRRIALLALHDVRGCVVQQLLDMAQLQDGQPVVRERICRQTIADMLGASRAMVSRVMMALTRSGELQALPDGSTLIRCDATGAPRRRQRPGRAAADGDGARADTLPDTADA